MSAGGDAGRSLLEVSLELSSSVCSHPRYTHTHTHTHTHTPGSDLTPSAI